MLELEEVAGPEGDLYDALQPLVSGFALELQAASSVEDLGTLAARQVRAITGFDRVLVYRFDERWNGTVIAEDRNEALPSYLDLRFPASDIPAQARELYRLQPAAADPRRRLRARADRAAAQPADRPAARPELRRPAQRLAGPPRVHAQHGHGARRCRSRSLRDGGLWGLISCHHQAPRRVPLQVRTACDLLGQIFSLQIAAKEHAATGRAAHAS